MSSVVSPQSPFPTSPLFPLTDRSVNKSEAQAAFSRELRNVRLSAAVQWTLVPIEDLWRVLQDHSTLDRDTLASVMSYEAYRKVCLGFIRDKLVREDKAVSEMQKTEAAHHKTQYLTSQLSLSRSEYHKAYDSGGTEEEKEVLLSKFFFCHPVLSPESYINVSEAVRTANPTAGGPGGSNENTNSSSGVNSSNPQSSSSSSASGGGGSAPAAGGCRTSPPPPMTSEEVQEKVKNISPSVPLTALFRYLAKKLLLFELRHQLELASTTSKPHCVCSDDLQEFLARLLPHFRMIRDMPPGLVPYYLCHASQRFAFTLDIRGRDEIPINSVLTSSAFESLLFLYEHSADDAIVAYPVGTILQINDPAFSQQQQQGEGGNEEVPLIDVVVESYEGEGNSPRDRYTVSILRGGSGSPVNNSNTNNSGLDESPLIGSPIHERGAAVDGGDLSLLMETPSPTKQAPPSPTNSSRTATTMTTLEVSRECLYYCSKSLARLPQHIKDEQITNWFSLPVMSMLYDQFCELDVDMDGFLSPEELAGYNSRAITPIAIERIFDVHVRGSGGGNKMDYKAFLQFVIAMEYSNAKTALKYCWKILDIHHTESYITAKALRMLAKDISVKIADNYGMDITGESIVGEMLDVINPADEDCITFEDVQKCKMGGMVLPLFIDSSAFYRYENREQLGGPGGTVGGPL